MKSCHVVLGLSPGAPLLAIASALEVMRHANRFSGTAFYRTTLVSENDRPITDSSGQLWRPQAKIATTDRPDLAFLVVGVDAGRLRQPRLCTWMAKQAHYGTLIGGISNGAFLLAAQGLLDRYNATTHWEDFESFCLLFPQVNARYQRFVIDRKRLTCAGGTATLDLFIELARQHLGNDVAVKISRQMLLQEESVVLPGSPRIRQPGRHCSAPIRHALSQIEARVGESITVTELARAVGLGRRELLRTFRRELNTTPSKILGEHRLDRARSLILNTRLPMALIADAVGFSSQSHLTSRYRLRFGITPARQRRERAAANRRLPLSRRENFDW